MKRGEDTTIQKPSKRSRSGSRIQAKKSTISKVTAALRRIKKRGQSLTRVARDMGISPRTILRHAGSALEKSKSGRYKAKQRDKLVRELLVPTASGPQEIQVRNSRDASRLGSYWSALHKYYESGDTSGLKKFEGQFITDVSRTKYPLITDLDVLNQLGSAGAVSFESIYSWSAQ